MLTFAIGALIGAILGSGLTLSIRIAWHETRG